MKSNTTKILIFGYGWVHDHDELQGVLQEFGLKSMPMQCACDGNTPNSRALAFECAESMWRVAWRCGCMDFETGLAVYDSTEQTAKALWTAMLHVQDGGSYRNISTDPVLGERMVWRFKLPNYCENAPDPSNLQQWISKECKSREEGETAFWLMCESVGGLDGHCDFRWDKTHDPLIIEDEDGEFYFRRDVEKCSSQIRQALGLNTAVRMTTTTEIEKAFDFIESINGGAWQNPTDHSAEGVQSYLRMPGGGTFCVVRPALQDTDDFFRAAGDAGAESATP